MEASDIINIIVPIGTAVIGGAASIWWERRRSSLQYIEYEVTKTNNLLNDVKDAIAVSVANRQVTNFGVLAVKIYNRTREDYENVRIHLELQDRRSPDKRFNILSVNIDDPEGIVSEDEGAIKGASVLLTVLNRTGNVPAITITMIIEDIESADCLVTVKQRGLKARLFKPRVSDSRLSFAASPILLLASIVVGIYANVANFDSSLLIVIAASAALYALLRERQSPR